MSRTGRGAADVAGLAEPLTGRELEVLTLLAAGKPDQQIADEPAAVLATIKEAREPHPRQALWAVLGTAEEVVARLDQADGDSQQIVLRLGDGLPGSMRAVVELEIVLPGYAAYDATKGAVEQFTHILAKEFGPRRITVNAVRADATETETYRAGKSAQFLASLEPMSAFGRLGRPAEIAAVVTFLASDAAGWVTAQNIRVNGGTA